MFGGKTTPACLLDPCSWLKNMIDWQESTQRTNPQLREWAKGEKIGIDWSQSEQTKRRQQHRTRESRIHPMEARYEHLPAKEQYQSNPRVVKSPLKSSRPAEERPAGRWEEPWQRARSAGAGRWGSFEVLHPLSSTQLRLELEKRRRIFFPPNLLRVLGL
jgi:hypothetical protein